MKNIQLAIFAFVITVPSAMLGAQKLILPAVTVGHNLEVAASVKLAEAAPANGLVITLTSGDPDRLLFSATPDAKGTPSLITRVYKGRRESSEFYVQGFGKTGEVTYSGSAPEVEQITGMVKIAPAGIVITTSIPADRSTDRVLTTIGAPARKIKVYGALLDDSMHYVATQLVAGGSQIRVDITSSEPGVGTVVSPQLTISGGEAFAQTKFQPRAVGSTKLAVSLPPGFEAPSQFGELTAAVVMPAIVLGGQTTVGKNLQSCSMLQVGYVAPQGGIAVSLISDNPNLLISANETSVGSASLKFTIPEGSNSAPYCLQSLADAGTAIITASASGCRSNTYPINLTPSGMLLGVMPPDEADLFRKEAAEREHGTVIFLSGGPVDLKAFVEQLDPVYHRGADITVQPLRAGISATVELKSSDPTVGTIASPITIRDGSEASAKFVPLRAGKTVISISTPNGFTTPANATSYSVFVQ